MPTIQDNINEKIASKEAARLAIEAKGVSCPTSLSIDAYADKILAIPDIVAMTDPVTVKFNWLSESGEPMIENVTVKRGASVTEPAGFNDGVNASHIQMMRTATTGLPTGVTLDSVPYDLFLTANYFDMGSLAGFNVVDILVDNTNGSLMPTLNITNGSTVTSINWGDGTVDNSPTFPFTHRYTVGGVYRVSVNILAIGTLTISDSLWANALGQQQNEYSSQVREVYINCNMLALSNNIFEMCTNLNVLHMATYNDSAVVGGGILQFNQCINLKYINNTPNLLSAIYAPIIDDSIPYYTVNPTPVGYPTSAAFDGNTWPRIKTLGSVPAMLINNSFCMRQGKLETMPHVDNAVDIGNDFCRESGIRKTVPLPSSLTSIGSNFMAKCFALVDASNLFQNVAVLGTSDGFMMGCKKLKYMGNLPIFTNDIRDMFWDCYSLKSLPTIRFSASQDITNLCRECLSLTEIGNELDGSIQTYPSLSVTLYGDILNMCVSLKALYRLPPNTSFSMDSFCKDCWSLQTVDLRGQDAGRLLITQEADGSGSILAFENCYSLREIIVDASQLAAYKSMGYGWNKYYDIITTGA